MPNKHMKIYSITLVIREMQIKAIIRYHYTSSRKAKISNTDIAKFATNSHPWLVEMQND